jgi:hypothetical protein
MDPLPLPSDVKTQPAAGRAGAALDGPASAPGPQVEPPSAKLIVRLFLIPLLIVGAAVGLMWIVGMLAGGQSDTAQILARLRRAGGERTAGVLVGPAAKQRYLDAAALAQQMKTPGRMTEEFRLELSDELVQIVTAHTRPEEGEIRQFLLLALGRTWQIDPAQGPILTPQAETARQRVVDALLASSRSTDLAERKAAILAMAYLSGYEQIRPALPALAAIVGDSSQDLDARLAAATVLGPAGRGDDPVVVEALLAAMRESDPRNAELVWSAALSLAQLNRLEAADTVLMLLDREQLAGLRVYDRQTDPENPAMRPLGDQEILRYLVNTIIGARKLDEPRVQARLRELRERDPSPRVRAAAAEVLDVGASPVAPAIQSD